MQRRIIQKEEAKCNFCSNWFDFGLNICEPCIYKSLNTNCFKLPSPQGYLYQVYLAKRHISINPDQENANLEIVDEFMHSQIKILLKKWEQIAQFVKKKDQSNVDQWKQIQFILSNDVKRFEKQANQTVEQITQDTQLSQFKDNNNNIRTPLKQKQMTANITIKCLDTSIQNSQRQKSKKSLGLRKNAQTSSKKSLYFHQKLSKSKQYSPSPFQLEKGSRVSSRSRLTGYSQLEESNREFQGKIQATKNNIVSYLEDKYGKKPMLLQNIKKQKIYETIQHTSNINKCIELVSYKIPNEGQFDMACYLANLDWDGVQIAKFVKVGLTDVQIKDILACLAAKDRKVETLVLTNNCLTQQVCRELLKWQIPSLKNIYLGKNNILPLRVRDEICQLRGKYRIFV